MLFAGVEHNLVSFAGDVTVSNIGQAYDELGAVLHETGPAVVDIDGVTETDLTFVQLIEAARRKVAGTGRDLTLRHPAGGAVLEVLRRGGFLDHDTSDRTKFWLLGGFPMTSILTVDDSASIRQAIKIALSGEGYAVTEAANGQEGLDKGSAGGYDLIVTDLNMPVMDGLAMIRELRKRPAGAGVPILFLTTESDAEIKAQAKAAGATGWLTKPFDPEQLVRVVKKVLAK